MNLDEFARHARRTANANGYSDMTPFAVYVAGPTVDHMVVNRWCIVSNNTPDLVLDTTIPQIWIDSSLRVWKSSNWYRPTNPTWEQIYAYDDIFLDAVPALTLQGGTLSGPIILFRDPIAQNEAVTKNYVDGIMNLIAKGLLFIERPVTTIAELRSLDATTIRDEQVIYVESARKLYAYDLQGTGTDDGSYVITPDSGDGRWIATVPNIFDGGILP